MYARVSTFEGPTDGIEAGVKLARDEILPEARKLEGWRGCVNLVDFETGKELLVTLWDTEEHLRASEASAARMRDQGSGEAGRSQVDVERYRVVIGEVHLPA